MEMTDAAIMDLLRKRSLPQVSKKSRARTAGVVPPKPVEAVATTRRTTRCTCGHCATCQDEARWERIFREKFADPDYYRQMPRGRSSLTL